MKKFTKIFGFLMILVLTLCFFACGKDDKKENQTPEKEATGETYVEIDEQDTTINELKYSAPKVSVPELPLDVKGAVDLTYAVEFTVDVDAEDAKQKVSGNVEVNLKANTLTFEDLSNVEAAVVVKVSLDLSGLDTGDMDEDLKNALTNLQLDLYLKEGILYASIPAGVMNGDFTDLEQKMVVSLDLNRVMEPLKAMIEGYLSELTGESEQDVNGLVDVEKVLALKDLNDASVSDLLHALTDAVPALKEAGLDDALITDIEKLLTDLFPALTYEDKKFTLSIDKETILNAVDAVAAFLNKNLDKMNAIFETIADLEGDEYNPLTSEDLAELRPAAEEGLSELTINDISLIFGLNDNNRVNKINLTFDVITPNNTNKCAESCNEYNECDFNCEDVRGYNHPVVTGELESTESSLSAKLSVKNETLDSDKNVKTSDTVDLNCKLETIEKGLKGNLSVLVKLDNTEVFSLTAEGKFEYTDNSLALSLNVVAKQDESNINATVKATLTSNTFTSVTTDLDTTTAMDMTDMVLALFGMNEDVAIGRK